MATWIRRLRSWRGTAIQDEACCGPGPWTASCAEATSPPDAVRHPRPVPCAPAMGLIVWPTGEFGHDPLRHYVAARERDGWLVFGNGEQVTLTEGE